MGKAGRKKLEVPKIVRSISLSQEIDQRLIEIAAKDFSGNRSVALESMIMNYGKKEIEIPADIKNNLTAIRVRTNYTEKNTQIIVEMLNTLLNENRIDRVSLTDEEPNPVFLKSKKVVLERVSSRKQYKDNNKKE